MAGMTSNFVAIIPARGGSKGIPRKNLINFAGKPLISWTLDAALRARYVSEVYVSSDDSEILLLSSSVGAKEILRPDVLADDFSSSEDVVFHALSEIQKTGKEYDYAIYLQPTSPLRNYQLIEHAIECFFDSNKDALISVSVTDNKILKSLIKREDGVFRPISNTEFLSMNRQQLPLTYAINGAIYIFKIADFLNSRSIFSKNTMFYEMDPKHSIDIDTYEDLKLAESLLP